MCLAVTINLSRLINDGVYNSLPALELPDRRSVARIILASGGDINCGQDAIYGSGAGPGIRQIVMMQPHVCCAGSLARLFIVFRSWAWN